MSTQLQKQVEKQKKEAEKKFSSWFINKFKKDKTQYLRDQDEKSAEAERLRRQKALPTATAASTASTTAASKPHAKHHRPKDYAVPVQHQQSFLRAQLLEMKRHSHEVLQHAKNRDEDHSSDEEYDEVHSVLGDGGENNNAALHKRRSRTRMRRSLTASSDGDQSDNNQTDDEDEEKKGNDTDDEDNNHKSLRNSFTSNGGGSQRNSVSEELDRRSSRATLLYEEAIHALEDVLHPELAATRMRRSDSASKRLFAQPESEWI